MTISTIYQKPTGAKSQNTDWITDATPVNEAGFLIIQVAINSAVKLQVTLDGTNYDYLNGGDALVADTLYRFQIDVDNTMTFNMNTDDASGTTITSCLIKEYPVILSN